MTADHIDLEGDAMPTDLEVADKMLKTPGVPQMLNISREQVADKMWSESCEELTRIRAMLVPAFKRHAKALEETGQCGRDNNFQRGMGKLLTEAWREFLVHQQVEKERAR